MTSGVEDWYAAYNDGVSSEVPPEPRERISVRGAACFPRTALTIGSEMGKKDGSETTASRSGDRAYLKILVYIRSIQGMCPQRYRLRIDLGISLTTPLTLTFDVPFQRDSRPYLRFPLWLQRRREQAGAARRKLKTCTNS
jgi:hypothetical protein